MILGIGVDTVDVERFEKTILKNQGLEKRLFTPAEQGQKLRSLAARFAAKEALIKALGGSFDLGWHDIEILPAGRNRPGFTETEKLLLLLNEKGAGMPHLSISHDGPSAVAFVVLETAQKEKA